jgi:PhnB protein
MAADTPNAVEHRPQAGVCVSLGGGDEGKLRGYWDQLSRGATVMMPFEKAPWGATFGVCLDRFGTNWIVDAGG